MANQDDVRRIALSLPDVLESDGYFSFSVKCRGKRKSFAWVWLERIHPKKGRVPNPAVLAVRVRDTQEKEMLLATEPELFFTEEHYNGYPAVLVRLPVIDADDLRDVLQNAWRCMAPPELIKKLDTTQSD